MKAKDFIVFVLIIIIIFLSWICYSGYFKKPQKVITIKKTIEKTEIDWQKENIVFLGDSITEIYPIQEIFGNLPIVRSGVSGYRTKDILDRMDSMVYQYNPTIVFLLIGTNDYAYDNDEKTTEELVSNIKKIIEEIKDNRKNAKVYLESLYPVNNNMDKGMVGVRNNETIMKTNRLLKKYCDEESIKFINMYDELVDEEGNFDRKYTYDGLHPSALGYAKISQMRLKYLYNIY